MNRADIPFAVLKMIEDPAYDLFFDAYASEFGKKKAREIVHSLKPAHLMKSFLTDWLYLSSVQTKHMESSANGLGAISQLKELHIKQQNNI